jgi:hypothetical protein
VATPQSTDPRLLRLDRRDVLLMLAVMAGPFAWAVDELASYSLAPTACADGTKWMLYLVTLLTLLVSLGGAALANAVGRRLPEGSTAGGGLWASRARFLARSGAVLGLGFALAILAMAVPNLVLEVCQ